MCNIAVNVEMAKISSEITKLISKILIESDKDEENVIFTFPDEKKLKCSMSLLSEVSPVFKIMFGEVWFQGKKTVEMNDSVDGFDNFDQYTVFKLFLNILYGLCDVDTLTFSQATEVYFYSHKYQVDIVNEGLLSNIGDKIDVGSPSTTELKDLFHFVQLFELDELEERLDVLELDLDEENCYEFYGLAKKMDLHALEQQVINYCGSIEPDTDWAPEFLCLVIKTLQENQKSCEEQIKVFEKNEKSKNRNWKNRTSRVQRQGTSRWNHSRNEDQFYIYEH